MNKKFLLRNFLFDPDDDAGGGGAPASATADPWLHNGDDPDPGANDSGTSRPMPNLDGGGAPPAPVVATVDPKAFEAFGKSFGETFAKTQQQTAQQLPPTPEQLAEARKALKFFEINDDYVKKFGNLETQKQALEEFRDGITQHLVMVFNHLRGNDRSELQKMFEDRLTPVQSMIEERQNFERQQKFTSRFPQFADPAVAPHIESAISQLASKEAFKGKSEAESFKLVAELLAAQAKAYNPNFVLEDSAAGGASPSPSRNGNSIPVTSSGSGASRSGTPAAGKKGWALAHMK